MWPCGIITFVRELFVAESKAQVYGHLHQFLQSAPSTAGRLSKCRNSKKISNLYKHSKNHIPIMHNLEYICYDDGCHLRKYATNPCRCGLTATTKILSETAIVIDKMHMAGHIDGWCKKTCNPHLYPDLDKVNLRYMCVCFIFLIATHFYSMNRLIPRSVNKAFLGCHATAR